ncbi:MAG: methyltransferase domain-containing protein [Campylobacterales bacterium]|nr:methyltransferase domain-containing protein [Campylobacterales bacterium]
MNVQSQFCKNANAYESYNIIQNRVVKKLLEKIAESPQYILDIGCGSGAVYKSMTWHPKKFVAVDFAEEMLKIHPKDENTELYIADFNQKGFLEKFEDYRFERIISSSALQWGDNLDDIFGQISLLNTPISFAIFTSGTFKTLLKTASIPPLLRSKDTLIELSQKYFDAEHEVLKYSLEFASVRDMFQYMKKSGVGGGRNILSVKQMRELMNNYPLNYLEFEIILIHEKS